MNYLDVAYKEALKAYKKREVPVGCVIVYNGKIISKAHNLKERKNCAIKHAEIIAIEKASKKLKSWRLEHCEIYVTLEPCIMCTGAIIQSRLSKVYYGAVEPKTGGLGGLIDINNLKLNHKVEVNFLDDEKCSNILSSFFKERRNRNTEN